MTREERWIPSELRLLELRSPADPPKLAKHYAAREAVLQRILHIVLHAQEYDRQTRRSRRARGKLPIAVRRERIRDRNARVLV